MVMPVYRDDGHHGRSQTWAEIARKLFCLDAAEGLSTPTGPDLLGDRGRNVPS